MISPEDIQRLIQRGVGLQIEFKKAKDGVPSNFYDTVTSFSNTDGGTILLGVDDDGNVKGINPNSETKIKKDIITALNSPDLISPPVMVEPFSVSCEGGNSNGSSVAG
ncbi:MAG: ATP-binding protein [Bacteroidales bacterium]|jgi:ATP-dependent DNA helicase RecG|nr:ATP-binding protein [Bacteroidales bacterium]